MNVTHATQGLVIAPASIGSEHAETKDGGTINIAVSHPGSAKMKKSHPGDTIM